MARHSLLLDAHIPNHMMIRYEDSKSRKCPYCNKKCMKPAGTFSLMEDAPAGSDFEVIRESYICLICGLMLEFREVQKKVQDMRRTTDSTQLRELARIRNNMNQTLTNKTFEFPRLSDKA